MKQTVFFVDSTFFPLELETKKNSLKWENRHISASIKIYFSKKLLLSGFWPKKNDKKNKKNEEIDQLYYYFKSNFPLKSEFRKINRNE